MSEAAAATIIAEIGTDMGRFFGYIWRAGRGVCPGNHERGRQEARASRTGGDTWLKAVLGEVAWAVARTRDNYLSAQYHRIARRRGKLIAVAVCHSVLVIAYHVLKDKRPYRDLGADYFDRLDTERIQRHHVNRLKAPGRGGARFRAA